MQDLVAEYQQYQDATYVPLALCPASSSTNVSAISVEEEAEYEEEAPAEEDQ
jgi:hypothetical protein